TSIVHKLLEFHRESTGSAVAAELLTHWPRAASGFTKVIPSEYKRALAAAQRQAAEELEGHDG
ncbi:MAG: hypothetical protein ACRD0P_27755, partial [Stackebrandtia sp.]